MVGHVVRFMPAYRKLKEWIDNKQFGALEIHFTYQVLQDCLRGVNGKKSNKSLVHLVVPYSILSSTILTF